MKRSKMLLVAGIVAGALVVSAAPALGQAAAGQAPQDVVGGICRGAGSAAAALTDLLGMQPEEIAIERRLGASLADIAEDKGVGEAEVIDALVGARKAALDQAVGDGRMTQAQADTMLARMKANVTARVQSISPGGCGGTGADAGGADCGGTGAAGAQGAGCGGVGGAGTGCGGPSGAGCGGGGISGGTTS